MTMRKVFSVSAMTLIASSVCNIVVNGESLRCNEFEIVTTIVPPIDCLEADINSCYLVEGKINNKCPENNGGNDVNNVNNILYLGGEWPDSQFCTSNCNQIAPGTDRYVGFGDFEFQDDGSVQKSWILPFTFNSANHTLTITATLPPNGNDSSSEAGVSNSDRTSRANILHPTAVTWLLSVQSSLPTEVTVLMGLVLMMMAVVALIDL